MSEKPTACPYCGHERTIAKGYRDTKEHGRCKVRKCKSCQRRHTVIPKKRGLARFLPW